MSILSVMKRIRTGLVLCRKSLTPALTDIFLPRSCFVCFRNDAYLCPRHIKLLRKHADLCYLCHRPTRNATVCLECPTLPIAGVVVSFIYTNLTKMMIRAIKYDGTHDVLSFFAEQAHHDLRTNTLLWRAIQQGALLITSVPMHHHKQHYERGYNQSEIFARHLSTAIGAPYIPLLTKPQHTHSQALLDRTQRLTNVYNAYQPTWSLLPSGVHTVLIVDDVLTTGSTLQACARVIRENYPGIVVRGLCIARHSG